MKCLIDNKIIIDSDNIQRDINLYYVQNKVDCNVLYIDIDKFLSPYPRQDILYKLVKDSRADMFAISNQIIAKKLNIPFVKAPIEFLYESEVMPADYSFNKDDFVKNVEKLNHIIKQNNIVIGPGRGSAVHYKRFYDIGLTAIDTEKYNLHESRFIGFRKNKIDIDIDIDTKDKDILVSKFNNSNNIKLIQKLNSRQQPHNSGFCFCDKNNILKGEVILKKVNNRIYISKTQLPGIDLLSSSVISKLQNTNWKQITNETTSKKLHKDIFHIGNNELAYQLWETGNDMTIDDISFILAVIRPGAAEQLKDMKKYNIKEIDDVLQKTNNCLIYQDQITQIISNIFNMNLYQSDTLRKKVIDIIPLLKKTLLKKGYIPNDIADFLDLLYSLSKYLFCKGHSLAYATIIMSQLNHGIKQTL